MHETGRRGNLILQNVLERIHSEEPKHHLVPPFFVFQKYPTTNSSRSVQFKGLAIWRKDRKLLAPGPQIQKLHPRAGANRVFLFNRHTKPPRPQYQRLSPAGSKLGAESRKDRWSSIVASDRARQAVRRPIAGQSRYPASRQAPQLLYPLPRIIQSKIVQLRKLSPVVS